MSTLGSFRTDMVAPITPSSFRGRWTTDTATQRRASLVHDKMSSFYHRVANEPTVGLYHVQQHIRRSVPKCVEMKKDLSRMSRRLDEVAYDADLSLQVLDGMKDIKTFRRVNSTAEHCIALIRAIESGAPAPPRPAASSQASNATSALASSAPTSGSFPSSDAAGATDAAAPTADGDAATEERSPSAGSTSGDTFEYKSFGDL